MSAPTAGDEKDLAHLLQYIVDTKDMKLKGYVKETDQFEFTVDSNHGGGKAGARARTAILSFLNGTPVDWTSKKQPVTALSSAEAEIYALMESVKRARSLTWRAQELGIKTPSPILIKMDNKAGIAFQKSTCASTRLGGTFDLRDKRLIELRNNKIVTTAHIATDVNPADLLTKSHPPHRFKRLMQLIHARCHA